MSSSVIYIAIDYGEKFCGTAWCDDYKCVLPGAVIPIDETLKWVKEKIGMAKGVIVLGLPLEKNMEENDLCRKIREFSRNFEAIGDIHFFNERYSSKIARRNIPHKKKRYDDIAAMNILESWNSRKNQ